MRSEWLRFNSSDRNCRTYCSAAPFLFLLFHQRLLLRFEPSRCEKIVELERFKLRQKKGEPDIGRVPVFQDRLAQVGPVRPLAVPGYGRDSVGLGPAAVE